MIQYHVQRLANAIRPSLDWSGEPWREVPRLSIDRFAPETGDHRPVTEAKLVLAGDALQLLFRVEDCFVRSVATQDQQAVCRDSCVEFFVQPTPGAGYFNFEFNCGGIKLVYYIEDPGTPTTGLQRYVPMGSDLLNAIETRSTLPRVNPVEIQSPTEWRLHATIPLRVMAALDVRIPERGDRWRANFYKCGDGTSHPHWASWSDLEGGPLSFHRPERFGELLFV